MINASERDEGFRVIFERMSSAATTPLDYIASGQDGAKVLNTGLAATLAIDALIEAGWRPQKEGEVS